MACLTPAELTSLTNAGCNNIQALINAFIALNADACGECTGVVPENTDPADFLTTALGSDLQPVFQPPSPVCEQLYVIEEGVNVWYVSFDGGATWRVDTSSICSNPFPIADGTDPADFITDGWGGVVPFQSVCPVLMAVVGCDAYFIVNDAAGGCDPTDGDLWTKITAPEGLDYIVVDYDSTVLTFNTTTEITLLDRYYFNGNVKDLNTPPTTVNSVTLPAGTWLVEYHITFERADDDLATLNITVNLRRDTSAGAVLASRVFFTSGVSDSVTPNYYGLPITLQGNFAFVNTSDQDVVMCISTGGMTKNSTVHSATANFRTHLT